MPEKTFSLEAFGATAEVKTLAPMHVAKVRHVGPYEECEQVWTTLMEWAIPAGAATEDALYLGVGHDDPAVTPPNQIRYDACVTVDDSIAPTPPVELMDIDGGDYLCAVVKGPYTELKHVYVALMDEALPALGREFDPKPCVEIYLNDPRHVPPQELLTEVRLAVK